MHLEFWRLVSLSADYESARPPGCADSGNKIAGFVPRFRRSLTFVGLMLLASGFGFCILDDHNCKGLEFDSVVTPVSKRRLLGETRG